MLSGKDAPPIRPITGRRWLAPRSYLRCPVGPSCERLSRPPWSGGGRTSEFPRSADVSECWGRVSPPAARHLRPRSSGPRNLAAYLLVQAIQQLALVPFDGAYDASPGLTRCTR